MNLLVFAYPRKDARYMLFINRLIEIVRFSGVMVITELPYLSTVYYHNVYSTKMFFQIPLDISRLNVSELTAAMYK